MTDKRKLEMIENIVYCERNCDEQPCSCCDDSMIRHCYEMCIDDGSASIAAAINYGGHNSADDFFNELYE